MYGRRKNGTVLKKAPLVWGCLVVSLCVCSFGRADEQAEVDRLRGVIAGNGKAWSTVAVIDHGRLAAKAGVPMPPSIVTLFSVPAMQTELLQRNQRLGVDLPLKLLTYAEGDRGPRVAYVSKDFLSKRHRLPSSWLEQYDEVLRQGLQGIPIAQQVPTPTQGVDAGYGLIEWESAYSLADTLQRIRKAVLSQGDTQWFGSVDFQQDAAKQNVRLRPTVLLLFGGPGPGGKAMAEFPRLGLDAFCQKLLVFEDEHGKVRLLFNDIVALAKLHYGRSNKPQAIINQRLKQTFAAAIGRSAEGAGDDDKPSDAPAGQD